MVEGTPAPGYEVGAITAEPSTVQVRGPDRRTRGPIAVRTARINVAGRSTTLRTDVSVHVDDPQLRIAQPRTVRVTVQIDPVTPGEVR